MSASYWNKIKVLTREYTPAIVNSLMFLNTELRRKTTANMEFKTDEEHGDNVFDSHKKTTMRSDLKFERHHEDLRRGQDHSLESELEDIERRIEDLRRQKFHLFDSDLFRRSERHCEVRFESDLLRSERLCEDLRREPGAINEPPVKLVNDKGPVEAAEVEPATSNIKNCSSDFETKDGKETSKKLDYSSKPKDIVSKMSRSNKSTKGYDPKTGEIDSTQSFQEKSRGFSPFSLLGRGFSRYTLDLPEMTYSINKSSTNSTLEALKDSSYSYCGFDGEQTNIAKSPAHIMHGSAVIAKENPLGFSHLDQVYHPSQSEESDDDSLIRSQINPYHHKISTCGEASASSTPYSLSHKHEAHDIYGNTTGNKVLSDSMSQLELRIESEPGIETDSDEVSEIESDFEIDGAKYVDLIWLRDILQHNLQQVQEADDGQTKQDFCLIKDSLICFILESFWSWSKSRDTCNVTTCANTSPTSLSSSPCEAGSSEKSSQSSGQCGKRKQQANIYDSGERQSKRVITRALKENPRKEQLQFSCPFRKHNPGKYGVMQWQYCALTPYSNMARLKEHLIRGPHRVWECDRCRSSFKSEKDKINHAREEIPCSPLAEAYVEEEGIHPYHVEWLRAKGKSYSEVAGKPYSKQTETERWNTIYKKLFSCSDDMLPSPYFEEPIEERTRRFEAGGVEEFQQYFREELPHDFRRRAADSFTEDLIDQVSAILEQCASNVCTNFNERITKSSPCTQRSSHSSQSNPDPTPSSSGVLALEVSMPTNNSNSQFIASGENDTSGIGIPNPGDSDLTMSTVAHDILFPEINTGSGSSCQDSTTQSQSLFQESSSQNTKMRDVSMYNGNHEDQSAQDVIHNFLNSVFCDDLRGGSVEDLFTETVNANLLDGIDLGGDINIE